MLTPDRLLGVMIELIFVLLGALVAWLALRGRILVDRHSIRWLILGAGSRALQARPVVETLGKLDPRAFSCTSRSLDAGDYSRSLFLGGAHAHGGWRDSRASRNCGLGAPLPATLTGRFMPKAAFFPERGVPRFFSPLGYNPRY